MKPRNNIAGTSRLGRTADKHGAHGFSHGFRGTSWIVRAGAFHLFPLTVGNNTSSSEQLAEIPEAPLLPIWAAVTEGYDGEH